MQSFPLSIPLTTSLLHENKIFRFLLEEGMGFSGSPSISTHGLHHLLSPCPSMHYLTFSSCPLFSRFLSYLSCPSMHYLTFSSCPLFSFFLSYLSCPSMHYLTFSSCPLFSLFLSYLSCPSMHYLTFSSCPLFSLFLPYLSCTSLHSLIFPSSPSHLSLSSFFIFHLLL